MTKFNYELFQELIKSSKYRYKEMSEKLNDEYGIKISVDTLKSYTRSKNPSKPILDNLIFFADFFQKPISSFFSEDAYLPQNNYDEIPEYAARVPVVEIIAGAGAEGVYDSSLAQPQSTFTIDKRLCPKLEISNLAFIKVAGDSMSPFLEEGDMALIDMVNGRFFYQVNGTYLIRYGDTVQIKDVEFIGNGDIICSSRNKRYKEFSPVRDYGLEWEILGKVAGFMRVKTGLVLE